MRFDGLDLNLLVALEALIEERNVSAAARRLHLSQPAVTGALNRLRDYFRDELLVQSGRRMLPTPKAEQLAGPVRRALLQIRGEITRAGDFDPETARRVFVIAASDYAYTTLFSDVIRDVAGRAPGVQIEIVQPSSYAAERLDRAELDLSVTVDSQALQRHAVMPLWEDEEVIISWAGAGYERMDESLFFASGHAVATFGPDNRPSVTDVYLNSLGHVRRVEVRLPSFSHLCEAIVGTQRLVCMHRRYAEYFARFYPIAIHPTWSSFPKIVEVVQWHRVRDTDPGVQWLLSVVKARRDALGLSNVSS